MKKYDELVEQQAKLNNRAVGLEVWLRNYESGRKGVTRHTKDGSPIIVQTSSQENSFSPAVVLTNTSDGRFGHVILEPEDASTLFAGVHDLTTKLLKTVQQELAAVTAKIEAVEELLKG